jgi:superfamily II helicase
VRDGGAERSGIEVIDEEGLQIGTYEGQRVMAGSQHAFEGIGVIVVDGEHRVTSVGQFVRIGSQHSAGGFEG